MNNQKNPVTLQHSCKTDIEPLNLRHNYEKNFSKCTRKIFIAKPQKKRTKKKALRRKNFLQKNANGELMTGQLAVMLVLNNCIYEWLAGGTAYRLLGNLMGRPMRGRSFCELAATCSKSLPTW